MSNENIVRSLLAGTEFDDPRLYDLIDKLVADLYKAYNQLYPPTTGRNFGVTGSLATVSNVTGFSVNIEGSNIRLSWDTVTGAVSYEIRYQLGTSTDWTTARSLVITGTATASIDPVTLPLTIGTHTFLVRATDTIGNLSAVSSVAVTLNQLAAPSISSTVIDNFVLLKWTPPANVLNIAYYRIYKNGTFTGKMDGTFDAIFETVSGTFLYGIEAVDIAGNVGVRGSISVTVNQPPDYELQDDRISNLSGTRSNCALDNGLLVAIVDTCGV